MTARLWLLGLRRALTAVLLLVVLLALAVTFALYNEKASSFALERALSSLPPELTVERSSGALADGVTLYGVRYRSDQIDMTIAKLEVTVSLVSLLRAQVQLPMLTLTDSTIRITPGPKPTAPSPLTLPRLSAPIPISIDQLVANNTTIVTGNELVIEQVQASLSWRDTVVSADGLRVISEQWSVNSSGRLNLEGDMPIDLAVDWTWSPQALRGSGTLAGSLVEMTVDHELEGRYRLSSAGSMALLNRVVPSADLTHRCAGDCGVDGVELSKLELHHSGTVDASTISAQATVATARLPPTKITLRGHTRERSLIIDASSARGDALDADLTGSVALTPTLVFDLNARVLKLKASLVNPSTSGKIAGDAVVRGSGLENFRAVVKNIAGELNGYALTGNADVQRRGQRVDLKPLRLAVGDNTLVASGTIADDNVQLQVDAALADLSQVDARLEGALNAVGTVGGTYDSPRARFTIDGNTLRIGEAAIASISGDLDIDETTAVSGNLNAAAFSSGERDLGDAQLALGGTLEAVDVEAQWQLPDSSLTTSMVISRIDNGVHGDIRRAQLTVPALGTWSIETPFAVDIVAGTAHVSAHTWRNGQAFMRLDEITVGKDIVVNAELAGMPLQTFTPLLPVAVRLSGDVDASVALAREQGDWRGSFDWRQHDTLLRLAKTKGQQRMALPTFELSGKLAEQIISVDADIRGDHGLSVYGNLDITGAGTAADAGIEGMFAATLPTLDWLGPWVDGVSEVSGNGALNLQATGTVSSPALRGVVAINDAALALDDAGLRIENLALRGEAREGANIELSGRATSGGGTLDLNGNLIRPWGDERSVELNIKGSDVQAFNAADYRVWVSPDLTLKATTEGATVTGRVDVPRADIRVAQAPANVVRTSDDIEVEGRIEQKGATLPVDGDITLALGKQVHVFALGLDADLRGDLELSIAEGKEPTFNGRLYLENGKYAAYGQKLSIERGNLFYAGPIDNPVLDFRATRSISEVDREVVAGVRVSGPAQTPSIDVFAEPAMSQTEALAYLVLGRASVTASSNDGETLSRAALAAGLSRSSPLTSQIATGIGLDELTVAGDSLEAAELVAGKQVSDRLYIRYSFGVFSNLGAILLRYRLSNRFSLEAESADTHSLDVLYTIEK